MPTLYRCRTSLREVADLFQAEPPPHAEWEAELWPKRTGLVVVDRGAGRRIEPMRWGVPPSPIDFSNPGKRPPTSLWFGTLWMNKDELLGPAHRCLVIADSFALPDGPEGARTRTWYGFDDRPVFAWAGVWRQAKAGAGYAGLMVDAADPVSPNRAMPAILDGEEEYGLWLSADPAAASRVAMRSPPRPDMYREPTEQPWGADRTPGP